MVFIRAAIFIFLVSSSVANAANEVVTSIRIETDSFVENQLENQLETRLSRDINAYLNHSRFLINVDFDVVTTRTDTLVPINKKNTKSFPSKNTTTTTETKTLDSEGITNASGPVPQSDFTLPGLPLSSNSSVSEKIVTPVNETTKVVVEEESNTEESIEEESFVALSPHIVNSIEKMSIDLVLDDDINKSDQRFIENLILDKSQFSRIRGDEFQVVLTRFSKIEEATDVSNDNNVEKTSKVIPIWEEWWLWLITLLSVLCLMLIVMLLKRGKVNEPSYPALNVPSTTSFNNESLVNQSNLDKDVVVESFVSAALTDPDLVRNFFNKSLENEKSKRTLSALYETIPESMFNSLFSDFSHELRRELNDKKLTSPLSQSQKGSLISELVRDIEQLQREYQSSDQNSKVKPFSFLTKLNSNQIIYVLNEEPAKIQALVISQLENEKAAEVFAKLSKELSKEIIVAFGEISEFPLDSFRYVAERLARKAIDAPSFENIHADGIDILSNVLDEMSEMEARASLESLKNDSPDLYIRIKDIYLTFDEVYRVPELKLGDLLTQFDKTHLAHLISGAAESTSAYMLNSMTNKMRISVKEEMSQLKGSLDQGLEKEARISLIKKIRSGIKSGQITLKDKE